MASAKSHTGSTLDGTKTVYWNKTTEGGYGPTGWDIIPSVDCDLYITGGYLGNEGTTEIRILANEVYTVLDRAGDITQIEANKESAASAGTIIIRPVSMS